MIESRLTAYLEEQFLNQGEQVDLSRDDDLVDLGLDSIGYVRLVAFINDTFGVAVPDRDLTIDQFGTVGRIADYLAANGARND